MDKYGYAFPKNQLNISPNICIIILLYQLSKYIEIFSLVGFISYFP